MNALYDITHIFGNYLSIAFIYLQFNCLAPLYATYKCLLSCQCLKTSIDKSILVEKANEFNSHELKSIQRRHPLHKNSNRLCLWLLVKGEKSRDRRTEEIQ